MADAPALEVVKKLGGRVGRRSGGWDLAFHLRGRGLTDAQLGEVARLKDVVALNLRDTKVTSAGLRHLASMPKLQRLHLERTAITDDGTEVLAGMADLRYLNLYGTEITDRTLVHLEGLKNLASLYVWQTGVTDAGLARLAKARPRLRIVRGVDLAKLPALPAVPEEPKPKVDLEWKVVSDRNDVPKSESGINTRVIFQNASKQKVKIYWVGYDNKLRLYGELAPNAKRDQNTYARNTWLITNSKDEPLGYFLVGEEVCRAVIPES